jgi:hypothetical protein
MRNWFYKNLGDPLLAEPALAQIKSLYATHFANANPPDDLAIFVRHESEGRLHCEVMVYFSPAAAAIARAVAAIACQAPTSADLGLLAGADSAWSILFPEK